MINFHTLYTHHLKPAYDTVRRHPILSFVILFAMCWVAASIIFYLRFPQSFLYANFFAEDGSVFLKNTLDHGPASLFTPFNGYFVIGIYICVYIGRIINTLFLGGQFFNLPQAFAVASYITLGLSAAACLFLRKFVGTITATLVVFMVATLPLPNTTHQVIGSIGNLKWIFFFIAYIVALYWIINRKNLTYVKALGLAGVILLCLYTNAYCYLLLPIIGLPYLYDFLCSRKLAQIKKDVLVTLRQRGFQAFLGLGSLSLIQLLYVKLHGIPAIAGYLDTPFQWSRGIEIILGRTVLFEGIYPIWTHLNDAIVVILFLALIGLGVWLLRGLRLYIFFASIISSIGATLLFIATRPGISGEFSGYHSTGPDHFFYAQNLIMYIPVVLIISALSHRIFPTKVLWRSISIYVFSSFIILANVVSPPFISHNNLMDSMAGTFKQNLLQQCHTEPKSPVVPLYPIGIGFYLPVPASACQNIQKDLQPSYDTTLSLETSPSSVLPVNEAGYFEQTFTSHRSQLDGIRVILSTYGAKHIGRGYTLLLMDGDCRTVLRQAEIGRELFDNYPYNIRFDTIKQSKDVEYCFTVKETVHYNKDELALRGTASDAYPDGSLFINGQKQSDDLVFWPLYSDNRQ